MGEKSMQSLQGLFNWSMQFQGGEEKERPSHLTPEQYDQQKLQWLAAALETYAQVQDPAARMRQIKMALDMSSSDGSGNSSGATAAAGATGSNTDQNNASTGAQGEKPAVPLSLEDKEALLEELADWVTSIDNARDLHLIGGLPTLLTLMDSKSAPSLRWRAAEVAATCMANHPAVQQWFLEGGLLPKLLAMLDVDGPSTAGQQQQQGSSKESTEMASTLRVKGLLALSALVRHCKPALESFCSEGGLARLVALTGCKDSRVQRKALNLLQYLLSQRPHDISPALQLGCLEPCVESLHQGDEAVAAAKRKLSPDGFSLEQLAAIEQAGAAAGVLLEAARSADGWSSLKRYKDNVEELVGRLHTALAALPTQYKESVERETIVTAVLKRVLAGPMPPPVATPKPDHVDPSTDKDKDGKPVTITTPAGHAQSSSAAPSNPSGGNMGLSVVPDNRF